MELSIDNFWKSRFSKIVPPNITPLSGWEIPAGPVELFHEPQLIESPDFTSQYHVNQSPIILISAPGAVGKTTLARQLSYLTGAVFVNLAEADPVGGNTLSGGLVRSNVYQHWQANSAAVLIDGLDEARIRVTQQSFDAFISDIAAVATNRSVPTVLFGRTGAIQDTWLIFLDNGIEVPVFEIELFDNQNAEDFAYSQISKMRDATGPDKEAVKLILSSLRSQTQSDGDRFAGYAPVLLAIAERVAKETNPAALISQIQKGENIITIDSITEYILEREREKLNKIAFEDPSIRDSLYTPSEQIDRLISIIYGGHPPEIPPMSANDTAAYSQALETWVPEHPFIDGNGRPSSIVFDAAIAARGLRRADSAHAALQKEISKGNAANPFLSEFYLKVDDTGPKSDSNHAKQLSLPPEHVGAIYLSLRSQLAIGDAASLTIEGSDVDSGTGSEEDRLHASIEISLTRKGAETPRLLDFNMIQLGTIVLGNFIEDVDIQAPMSEIKIGGSTEVIFVCPVNIQCEKLSLSSDRVIAESNGHDVDSIIYLEANSFDGARLNSVPILRGNPTMMVSWPSSSSYPWTSFSTSPTTPPDPRIQEALRRLRKFVISFRSHSKGALARYRGKIEHERMTKGSGQAVLDHLVRRDIINLKGSMYYLDPSRLAELAGTNYADCVGRKFSEQTVKFVMEGLDWSG